tara:strand:- start:197 stop:940 length:744 start_codon:yes stop_codon:yes gene_type:complete
VSAEVQAEALIPDLTLSELTTVLETVWAQIRSFHTDLPKVAIVIATGAEGGRLKKLGHWAPGAWVAGEERIGEVLIGSEGLGKGHREVMDTLLHEAAHALADARGIQDTSRGGRYHNGKFQALAQELGCQTVKRKGYGWDTCGLSPLGEARYQVELDALEQVIRAYRYHPALGIAAPSEADQADEEEEGETEEEEEAKPKNKRIKVSCACETPRSFRISPSIFELGAISCECCGEAFAELELAAVTP